MSASSLPHAPPGCTPNSPAILPLPCPFPLSHHFLSLSPPPTPSLPSPCMYILALHFVPYSSFAFLSLFQSFCILFISGLCLPICQSSPFHLYPANTCLSFPFPHLSSRFYCPTTISLRDSESELGIYFLMMRLHIRGR